MSLHRNHLEMLVSIAQNTHHIETFAGDFNITVGSAYDRLRRAESRGWVETYKADRPTDGRQVTFYRTTPKGRAALKSEQRRLTKIRDQWQERADEIRHALYLDAQIERVSASVEAQGRDPLPTERLNNV